MKAYLKRESDNGKVTLGTFFFGAEGEKKIFKSLELPWLDNKKSISCIPLGTYRVITTFSNKYQKDMWLLLNVPDRNGIRIHSANLVKELEGCIALGMSNSDIDGDGVMDIKDSRKAINLAKYYLGTQFELKIYK